MKKLLLLFTAVLALSLTAGAQPVQKIMGHYDGDSISSEGFAVSTTTGVRTIAIMLEPEELDIFQGGKIVAIRVGLAQPTAISKVFVIPVLTNGKYGQSTMWECNVGEVGWNTVQLETPYDLNLEEGQKLLVGFYYQQELEAKPLSFVKLGLPYDTYTYTRVGSVSKWKEIGSTANGNLSVQCIVERDSYPDYRIKAYDLRTNSFVQVGDMLPFIMNLNNRGIKNIGANELGINLLIDGKQVATISNEEPFVDGYCTLDAGAPTDGLETGKHTLTVEVASVNGETLEPPISQDVEFTAYQQAFPRQKHLVEQFTSTSCTWCPWGSSMLSLLTSQRDDVIWVGIHGNLNEVDPFRSNQGDSIMAYLGCDGYPEATFDRSTGWSSDVSIANVISYDPADHQLAVYYLGNFFDYITESMPTFAEIKGDCLLDTETRRASVTIQGKMSPDFELMLGEDARLNVYVVEDSLVARQLNQGNWVYGYMHNGVFRKALGSVKGETLNRINGRYRNTYTFMIPNTWNMNHLRLVAFISRPITNGLTGYTDMFVNNAEVFSFQEANAVEEIVPDGDAVPVAYYDIMGRQHNSLQQGINIVKMSDGSSRKVLVK